MNFLAIKFIRFYQYFVSPLLPRSCRYHPTCSQYSLTCFSRFPFYKALWYSLKRILKCNQFFAGGVDEVPPQ